MAASHDDETVIDIDLGMTHSCAAVCRGNPTEIIADDQGKHLTPSCVAFTATAGVLVGEAAVNQATLNPANTIFGKNTLHACIC